MTGGPTRPGTSLHSELLSPLAELITTAAGHTQIVAVTHSEPLVPRSAARRDPGCGQLDEPAWHWPKR